MLNNSKRSSSVRMPRIKQSKPSKLESRREAAKLGTQSTGTIRSGSVNPTSPSSATDLEEDECGMSLDERESVSVKEESRSPPPVPAETLGTLPRNTSFGPFPALLLTHPAKKDLTNKKLFSLSLEGKQRHFLINDEVLLQWLKELKFTETLSEANCKLEANGTELRVITTATVKSLNDMTATMELKLGEQAGSKSKSSPKQGTAIREKKFLCDGCQTGFISESTLAAHKTFYCSGISVPTSERQPESAPKRPRLDSVKEASPTVPLAARPPPSGTFIPLPIGPFPFATSNLVTGSTSPLANFLPNVILLPVAHHSNNGSAIQVLGQPQVIVPVAVAKSCKTDANLKSPLILEDQWCQGLQIAADVGVVGNSASKKDAEAKFRLRLALRSSESDQNQTLRSTVPQTANQGQKSALTVRVSETEPLDLTVKEAEENVSSKQTSKKSPKIAQNGIQTNSPKECTRHFVCEFCGIRFSSPKTLQGHQQYYCRNSGANDLHNGSDKHADSQDRPQSLDRQSAGSSNGSTNRISPQETHACQYCDYKACTNNQLSQHLRSAHDALQGYLCRLCGYIGYSVRGMKSHMRGHATQSKCNVDELASTCIRPVSADSLSKFMSENTPANVCAYPAIESEPAENSKQNLKLSPSKDAAKSAKTAQNCDSSSLSCSKCQTAFADTKTKFEHECVLGEKFEAAALLVQLGKPVEEPMEDEDMKNSQDSGLAESVPCTFPCNLCAYKSQYKGNLKRHLALVHKSD